MNSCPLCASSLPDEHPAFHVQKFLAWVDGDWGQFEEQAGYYASRSKPIGYAFTVPGINSTVKLVARKSKYDSGDISDGYFDGELPQGTEFKTFLVFQIGDLFYKKTGTGDSYGSVSWDGDFRLAQKTTKTVEVFE